MSVRAVKVCRGRCRDVMISDLARHRLYLVGIGHGKEDLLQVIRTLEVPRHGVWNEHGLVVDLAHAEGLNALFEDTDDGERDAVDRDGLINGCPGAAIQLLRKGLDDHNDVRVGRLVFFIKEAPGQDLEVPYLFVLRTHPQQHRFLHVAVVHRDAIVPFQHG